MVLVLVERFHIDGWFPDESPDVSIGERLVAGSALRDCIDAEMNFKKDAVSLGLFNNKNELVGYIPRSLEAEARQAITHFLTVEVVEEYDEDYCYSPVVLMTDEEGRESLKQPKKKRWWQK